MGNTLEDLRVREPLRLLSLEITGKCNLTCSHCYAESGPRLSLRGEMAKEDWLRLIGEAAELGCGELTFIGGEPTLHPDLPAMIERAAALGFARIEVYTNATRLKSALLATLKRHGVELAASFYSADPAVHDRITGVRGSWRQTVDGLAAALAAGLPLRANIVEMEANFGQADAAAAFLQGLGLRQIRVDRLRAVGRGDEGRGEAGATAAVADDGGEHYAELCGQCWKGKLCVTSSGETFPCELARRTRVGDARLGLGRLLGSSTLGTFREIVRRMAEGDGGEDGMGGCGPVPEEEPMVCGPVPKDLPGVCGPVPKDPEVCGPVPAPRPVCGPVPKADPMCDPEPEPPCGPVIGDRAGYGAASRRI